MYALRTLAVTTALILSAAVAHARCTVTLKLTNSNSATITVLGDESQSRIHGGWYSAMGFDDAVLAGGARTDLPWKSKMSCGGSALRDLRIKYKEATTGKVFEELKPDIDLVDGGSVSITLKH
jgi:hypothetical protein